jgi:hypothetical protein
VAAVFLRCFAITPPFAPYGSGAAPGPRIVDGQEFNAVGAPPQLCLDRWTRPWTVNWSLVIFEDTRPYSAPPRSVDRDSLVSEEFRIGYLQACEDILMNLVRGYQVTGAITNRTSPTVKWSRRR